MQLLILDVFLKDFFLIKYSAIGLFATLKCIAEE